VSEAAARVGGRRAREERARPGFSGRLRTPASWASSTVNDTISNTVSSTVLLVARLAATKAGERMAREERAGPGFSGQLREKRPRRALDPENGLQTPRHGGR
jgi:hypothetical protein